MTCKWFDICPLRKFEKKNKINNDYKQEYCLSKKNWKNCKRYIMEEKGIDHKDNLMPDGKYL
jgi:hypothetical protein